MKSSSVMSRSKPPYLFLQMEKKWNSIKSFERIRFKIILLARTPTNGANIRVQRIRTNRERQASWRQQLPDRGASNADDRPRYNLRPLMTDSNHCLSYCDALQKRSIIRCDYCTQHITALVMVTHIYCSSKSVFDCFLSSF